MSRRFLKKIEFNRLYRFRKNVFFSNKILKNNFYIFYLGKLQNNFIIFDFNIQKFNPLLRLKYKYFFNYFSLFRFLKRIGFSKILPKFSNVLLFFKKF